LVKVSGKHLEDVVGRISLCTRKYYSQSTVSSGWQGVIHNIANIVQHHVHQQVNSERNPNDDSPKEGQLDVSKATNRGFADSKQNSKQQEPKRHHYGNESSDSSPVNNGINDSSSNLVVLNTIDHGSDIVHLGCDVPKLW
jgi:hypothetical protein